MKQTKIALFTTIASLMAASFAFGDVELGKPAPDFSLKCIDGKDHKLSENKGKFVVLEWTNHGCPWVKKQYGPGDMQKLQKTYTGKGVVWYTIQTGNSPSPEKWKKMHLEKKCICPPCVVVFLEKIPRVATEYRMRQKYRTVQAGCRLK